MLQLARIFQTGMVLQRDKQVTVWGMAEPGAQVSVSIQNQKAEATADGEGRWMARLDPLEASESEQMQVASGTEEVSLSDIAVGEVWVAGGQSNMGVPLVWVDPRHGDEKGAMIAQYVRRPFVRFAHNPIKKNTQNICEILSKTLIIFG